MNQSERDQYINDHMECLGGWRSLIIDLDYQLSKIDPYYDIGQIKEKFGGLRYYSYSPYHWWEKRLLGSRFERLSELAYNRRYKRERLLNEVVRKYEAKAWTVCEQCGSSADVSTTTTGWRKTRCASCHSA